MRGLRKWLLAACVVAVLGTTVAIIDMASSRAVVAQDKGPGDQWRNFDGHWSYWHEGDKRWYYTDGTHWYYHNGAAWVLYRFDKLFGLTGFHHGDYKVPGERVKVEVPRHQVYGHR